MQLFSFHNPGYSPQVNDVDDDVSSTGDKIYCQTTEPEEDDLRMYGDRKQKSSTRRRLILGVVVAFVLLFAIAIALVLRFAGMRCLFVRARVCMCASVRERVCVPVCGDGCACMCV